MSPIFAQPQQKACIVYFTQINEIWEQFLTYRVNAQGSSGTYFSSIRHPSKIVPHFTPEMRVTKLFWEMWDASYVQTLLDSFCDVTKIIPDIGLLFTHKNGYLFRRDFCNGTKLQRADLSSGESHYQGCQLSRIIRETPDFEPFLPVSRIESEISRIIAEVCNFL